ncbi:MAG: hypothetical protein WCO77_04655 [bacterium]
MFLSLRARMLLLKRIVYQSVFSCWSPGKKDWTVDAGTYGIVVGASSRDLRLKRRLKVK